MLKRAKHINSSGTIRDFLGQKRGHVHFAGICGVGMAGLAFLLKQTGFKISGCDLVPGRMATWLKHRGIRVMSGHDPAHIVNDVKWVIRSAAVSSDSPEIAYAAGRQVSVLQRGRVLPELIRKFKSVAVGGTHGKTTTTTFITQLLQSAGIEPSWCIGGESTALGGVAGVQGCSSITRAKPLKEDVIVVEADESDGTLALYSPDIAVVTNIEFDHMEHFKSVASFEKCFRTFSSSARQAAVYCADDSRAVAVCGKLANAVSYGLGEKADVRGRIVRLGVGSSDFEVFLKGEKIGRIHLPVPGIHNVSNALAATAVGLQFGLPFDAIRRGLCTVGLPMRRFETIVERNGISVVSDYAHHPSEIKALVQTALKVRSSRIIAVFQPHRYTRTLALGPDFPSAFKGINELVLVPVYAASESPLNGGSVWDLYEHFRRLRNSAAQTKKMRISVATSLEQAWSYLARSLRKGDLFLVVGAGDVEKIAGWAREGISKGQISNAGFKRYWEKSGFPFSRLSRQTKVRLNEPLGWKTTLGVGGSADLFVEANSMADLRVLRKWAGRRKIPFRIIGGGSNIIVSDLGVRGITVRLSGNDFMSIRENDGIVIAGAGVTISKLLQWLEVRSLTGLEFLEGIPGTVGGAVRMNAGAWGHEICERISILRCLKADGSESMVKRRAARFGYRSCSCLDNMMLVECGFVLSAGTQSAIREYRQDIRLRRSWMKGLRSAGSVFKNPCGKPAGKMLDGLGLKGARVGGAFISSAHANVIAAEAGACSSDVIALIEKARAVVFASSGLSLDMEVKLFE